MKQLIFLSVFILSPLVCFSETQSKDSSDRYLMLSLGRHKFNSYDAWVQGEGSFRNNHAQAINLLYSRKLGASRKLNFYGSIGLHFRKTTYAYKAKENLLPGVQSDLKFTQYASGVQSAFSVASQLLNRKNVRIDLLLGLSGTAYVNLNDLSSTIYPELSGQGLDSITIRSQKSRDIYFNGFVDLRFFPKKRKIFLGLKYITSPTVNYTNVNLRVFYSTFGGDLGKGSFIDSRYLFELYLGYRL